jgi:hypothetical protein
VPEQAGRFGRLEQCIQWDLPAFVWNHASILQALERYGLLLAVDDSAPPAQRQAALRGAQQKGLTASERRRILLRALLWGTPPDVMVMGSNMWFGVGSDAAAFYNPETDTIVILRQLVEAWESDPDDDVLGRIMPAVILHELVHYYNDQVLPGTDLYGGDTIHLQGFAKEAFAPLGWKSWQYTPDADVLKNRGVQL